MTNCLPPAVRSEAPGNAQRSGADLGAGHPNAIAVLALCLQGQTDIPFWVLDDSAMIQQLARGAPVSQGRRTRPLAALFQVTGMSPIGQALFDVIALALSLWQWRQAASATLTRDDSEAVLLGMGAGQEAEIRSALPERVAHVDERDATSLGTVARPRLLDVMRESLVAAHAVWRGIKRSDNPWVAGHRNRWLARAATHIGRYGFTKAWTKALPESIRRVVFLAPTTVSFAVLDALAAGSGIQTEWWQHGCIRYSSMYSRQATLSRMLTVPEARFLESLGPSGRVEIYFPKGPPRALIEPDNIVLLASQYETPAFKRLSFVPTLRSIFEWFDRQGHRVVVRPHPREDTDFWTRHFPGVPIEREPSSLMAHLEAARPRFLLGWYSTALIDGSLLGVPALVMNQDVNREELDDLVLDPRTLFQEWPRDRAAIEQLMASREAYDRHRRELAETLFGRR